jgi:hypothetical protein
VAWHRYMKILCYCREFLARPNPQVGRPGPTCPFIPKALKESTLYQLWQPAAAASSSSSAMRRCLSLTGHPACLVLCFADSAGRNVCRYLSVVRTGQQTNAAVIRGVVMQCIERFLGLAPVDAPGRYYKAIVLIFADVQIRRATELIDGVQAGAWSCRAWCWAGLAPPCVVGAAGRVTDRRDGGRSSQGGLRGSGADARGVSPREQLCRATQFFVLPAPHAVPVPGHPAHGQ